jgi:hypothetical protein
LGGGGEPLAGLLRLHIHREYTQKRSRYKKLLLRD